MNQENYSTTGQTLGWPVLDLTNPQAPTYTPVGGQMRSLAPACYRIVVKNTISITDATIVTCGTTVPAVCTEPGTCPTVDPVSNKYFNLKATMTASVAQSGIVVEFDYLYNDTPVIPLDNQISIDYTAADVLAGSKTIYLFDTGNKGALTINQTLYPDDTVSLYGARVVSY